MKVVGGRRVFSVEEVTARLATLFEGLRSFWVEAEVQDLRPSRSQVRFTLRGGHVIDASMNGVVYERLPHKPADGGLVQAYGRMEFWRARGLVSMRVERLEPVGEGLLRAQVEELRARLAAEGLLDVARKRRPPLLPRRIGLVTSADGAARADVLTNVWARLPEADVVAVDVPVQGDDAPRLIARALRHLDALPEVDVIVVARGGGSLEDLMAFNGEPVCRAVAAVGDAGGLRRGARARRDAVRPGGRRPGLDADGGGRGRRAEPRGPGNPPHRLGPGPRPRAAAGPGGRRGGAAGALRRPGARAGAGGASWPATGSSGWRRDWRLRCGGPRARGRRARRAGRQAMLGLLSPSRTVARGYAIVRDGGGRGGVADAAGVEPGRELELELRDGRVRATATGRPSRRRRGRGAARDLRGGPAPLDEVVARLEGGEVGLEEAVALFEQGQGYLAACRERLAAAQRRIEELTAEGLPPAPGEPPAGESEPPF